LLQVYVIYLEIYPLHWENTMSAQTASTTQSQNVVRRVAKADCRCSRNYPGLLASLGFAAFLLVSAPALAQVLRTASNFAVLGSTPDVTNTGNSVISGSVGVSPALAITGFPPGLIVAGTGALHAGDPVAAQARADTTVAYLALAGLGPATPIPVQLGGQVLGPGIYTPSVGGAFDLTGTLTLTGPGRYVFQMTAGLGTASGPGASSVVLQGGFSPCDVWWQVGSSAAIGTFSQFQGNILALTSITIATSANLHGRALARNGTVTLDTNAVTACSGGTAPGFLVMMIAPQTVPNATVGVPYSQQITASGGTGPYTFSMPSGTLPAGFTPFPATGLLSGTPTTAGSSTITIRATDVNEVSAEITYTIVSVIASASASGIPTLSDWAMIMLAALLAIAGFAAMRRKAR
jgi:hypothetical protein